MENHIKKNLYHNLNKKKFKQIFERNLDLYRLKVQSKTISVFWYIKIAHSVKCDVEY